MNILFKTQQIVYGGMVLFFGEIDLQIWLSKTISTLPSQNAVALDFYFDKTGTYIFIDKLKIDDKII